MHTDQNKALYRRFMQEIFNEGRLEHLEDFLADSYVLHDAPPGTAPGPEAVRQTVSMFRAAFPDLNITLEELIAEGDKVCSRSTMRGTHTGAGILGIAPSGRSVTVPGLTMVRIVDGRLTDSWVKNDVMSLIKQLGG